MSRRHLPTLFLALAILGLTACKDINITYKNKTPHTQTKLCVTVRIKNAPSFPAVSEWYGNNVGSAEPLTSAPDANGFYHYRICWTVNVPPGGSVHVGGTFAQDQDIEQVITDWEGPLNPPTPPRFPGASMRPRHDSQQGLVLDVFNSTDLPGGFTVKRLQWTAHTEHVALNNLDWTDPVLTLLTWRNVSDEGPFHLDPGESRTFDIPDGALAGKPYALIRWVTEDDEGFASEQPVAEIAAASLPVAEPGGIDPK